MAEIVHLPPACCPPSRLHSAPLPCAHGARRSKRNSWPPFPDDGSGRDGWMDAQRNVTCSIRFVFCQGCCADRWHESIDESARTPPPCSDLRPHTRPLPAWRSCHVLPSQGTLPGMSPHNTLPSYAAATGHSDSGSCFGNSVTKFMSSSDGPEIAPHGRFAALCLWYR